MNEETQLMNGKALVSERVDICRDSVIRSSVRIAIPEAAGTTPCESMNANRRGEADDGCHREKSKFSGQQGEMYYKRSRKMNSIDKTNE